MSSFLSPVWNWFHKWGSPRWFYEMSQPWSLWLGIIGGLLFAYGIIQGLFFVPMDFKQGDVFRTIYIHVPVAILAQSCYVGIALMGAVNLIWKMKVPSMIAKQMIPIGTSLAALALITGAIWGKPTWGTYWVWDARITSVLVMLLLYLGLWALSEAIEDENTSYKAVAVLALFGTVNIPIIKYSVDWWNTLHQGATFSITEGSKMDSSQSWAVLYCFLGLFFLYISLVLVRARIEVLKRSRKSKWAKAEFDKLLGVKANESAGDSK